MKEKKYQDYADLPLFLSVQDLADAMRISRTVAYELARREDFPSITIGSRIIVPREKFIAWVDRQTEKK